VTDAHSGIANEGQDKSICTINRQTHNTILNAKLNYTTDEPNMNFSADGLEERSRYEAAFLGH